MKKRISLICLISLLVVMNLICLNVNPILKVEAVSVGTSAKAMCVLEKDSKRVIYSKNMKEKLPMASTTKVVTAITVLQHCNDLEQYITVDDSAIGVEGTSIYLREGEVIKIKDLLYGLMLRSGNDAAMALACHVGGSVMEFTKMMESLAFKIGATSSSFANPHGLDNKNHFTTAHDLALITSYALNNPIFKEIVSTKNYVIAATNKSDKRYLTNKNKLLNTLDGCCGVKTGFTSKAGRCLVSAIERDNSTYVCVVLNCGPMFEESTSLLNLANENYKNIQIIDKNREIYNEYILDNNAGKLYLYAEEDFYYPLTEEEIKNIKLEYKVILDNVKEGDIVGEIKIFFQKDLISTVKLVTMNKIDKLFEENELNLNEVLWEEKINEN